MIGVFDSGFGGLSTLKKIIHKLPHYGYIYLGDNARTPYGDKKPKELLHHTQQAVRWFRKQKVPLVVFACNTATAVTLRKLQKTEVDGKKYPIRILGVIRPLAEVAVEKYHSKHIGIIATTATIKSGGIDREIKKLSPKTKIIKKAAPLLVPFIEKGLHHTPEMKALLQKNLKLFKTEKVDTLILGCTHYEHIRPEIQKIMGKKVHIIDQAEIVAVKLKDYLRRHPEVEKLCKKSKKREFFTTTTPENFWKIGKKMTPMAWENIHHTSLI